MSYIQTYVANNGTTWFIFAANSGGYWGQEDGVTSAQSIQGIGVTPLETSVALVMTDIDSGVYDIPTGPTAWIIKNKWLVVGLGVAAVVIAGGAYYATK